MAFETGDGLRVILRGTALALVGGTPTLLALAGPAHSIGLPEEVILVGCALGTTGEAPIGRRIGPDSEALGTGRGC